MVPQVALPSANVQEIARQVFQSRKLTREHQHYFMAAAFASSGLSEAEQAVISRLFDGVQHGLIRVVD